MGDQVYVFAPVAVNRVPLPEHITGAVVVIVTFGSGFTVITIVSLPRQLPVPAVV
jgi:hypothetical protein